MRRLALCLAALLAALAPLRLPAAERPRLMLSIESPENGALVGDPQGLAFVSGKALALFGEFQKFDIMFVIDTSDSTADPSGADVDKDGKIGQRRGEQWLSIFGKILPLGNTDRGDSILAAEIVAVEALLGQLDPRTTRVGIVRFAGDDDALTPDAWTQVPLTTDFDKVRRGLDEILDDGPHGFTNMVTAVNVATMELLGMQRAFSEKREDARRVMLFLTDGVPTLPIFQAKRDNMRMTISSAVRAAKLGIRIDTFAIGSGALSDPTVTVEMARVTDGLFTPVRNPKDLEAVFEQVNFADIDRLEIRNRTNGKAAQYLIRNPDGTFSGLLEMKEGRNTVEVYARSTDGTEARRQISVQFLARAGTQELSPRLLAQRNRLMENRLMDLQERSLKLQVERDERYRRDLKIEIDREREEARKRTEAQRKELEIEVERER